MQTNLGPIFYNRESPTARSDSKPLTQSNQERLLVCALLTGRELCQLVLNIRVLSCATYFKSSCLNPVTSAFSRWRYIARCKRMPESVGKLVLFLRGKDVRRNYFRTWMQEQSLSMHSMSIALIFYIRRRTQKVFYSIKAFWRSSCRARLIFDTLIGRRRKEIRTFSWQRWRNRTEERSRQKKMFSMALSHRNVRLENFVVSHWSSWARRKRFHSHAISASSRNSKTRALSSWRMHLFDLHRKRRAAQIPHRLAARSARRQLAPHVQHWGELARARSAARARARGFVRRARSRALHSASRAWRAQARDARAQRRCAATIVGRWDRRFVRRRLAAWRNCVGRRLARQYLGSLAAQQRQALAARAVLAGWARLRHRAARRRRAHLELQRRAARGALARAWRELGAHARRRAARRHAVTAAARHVRVCTAARGLSGWLPADEVQCRLLVLFSRLLAPESASAPDPSLAQGPPSAAAAAASAAGVCWRFWARAALDGRRRRYGARAVALRLMSGGLTRAWATWCDSAGAQGALAPHGVRRATACAAARLPSGSSAAPMHDPNPLNAPRIA